MTALAEAPPVTVPVPDVDGTPIVAGELVRLLTNAVPFASDDYTLPVLNAVYLVAEGTTLTVYATDRYKVLRQRSVLDEPAEWTLLLNLADVADLLQLIRLAGRGLTKSMRESATVRLTVTERKVSVKAGSYTTEFHPAVGTFPDTDRLFNDESAVPGAESVALNLSYLRAFAAIKSGLGSTPGKFTVRAADKPVRFDLGENITGLLMPIRESAS